METYNKSQHLGYSPSMQERIVQTLDSGAHTDTGYVNVNLGAGFTYTNSVSGFRNPKWKSIISSGGDATTTLTASEQTITHGYIDCGIATHSLGHPPIAYDQDALRGLVPLSSVSASAVPDDVLAEVSNRALMKFLDRANSIISSFELGQDLGEYKETIHGITQPMSSLRKHLVDHLGKLRKLSKIVKPAHALKVLADTYLEFHFGWKPLAADIGDAIVALQNLDRHFPVVPVSATAKGLYGGLNQPINLAGNGSLIVRGNQKETSEVTVRYKGSVSSRSVNGAIGAAQAFQLLPENFVPTIWDLIPYSFVADYFLNVGDIIRSYSFRKSNLIWCCKTTRFSTTREILYSRCESQTVPKPTTISSWLYGGHSIQRAKTTTRVGLQYLSLMPEFRFSVPWKQDRALYDQTPWVNIAALMTQFLGIVPFGSKH